MKEKEALMDLSTNIKDMCVKASVRRAEGANGSQTFNSGKECLAILQ